MENKNIILKQYLLESIQSYKKCKYILEKVFTILESNQIFSDNDDKYIYSDEDKKYLKLVFLLFFHHQKWINPKNIDFNKCSNFFQLQKNESHNEIEKFIIKSINSKNIKKIYIYWHFYVLSLLSIYFDDKNNNNQLTLIDIENILFQNNNKIINLYNSGSIREKDLFIFLYIYIFWIEDFAKNATHEKNLKIVNNILFSLLFDLLDKTSEIILCQNFSQETNADINLFFSFFFLR